MKKDQKPDFSSPDNRAITIALAVFFIEGLAALVLLLAIPSDREGGVLLGFSAGRLMIAAAHAGLIGFITYLLFFDRRLKVSLIQNFLSFKHKTDDRWIGAAALLLMVVSWLPLQLLNEIYLTTGSFREFAYYQRLIPTLGWLFLIGLQIFIWVIVHNRISLSHLVLENRSVLIPALIIISLFILTSLFVAFSGIGIKPDKYGWGAPGVPLMEWQIWIAILLAFLSAAVLGGTFLSRSPLVKKDVIICIGVWLVAVIIWGSQPVPPGFFATPGRLPNFEIYPFSDGAFYDFYAQNIVIGNGYRGMQIPPRPLYILFLAMAHFLVGQDYNLVVLVQTFLLAFIPVAIYLLGRILHSTTAGLAASFMAIFRELTTILSTPFTDDVSNSKLLFADLPATLGITLVIVTVLLWLRNTEKRSCFQMIAGLAMGLLILVRTQSMLILPVIFVVVLIEYRRRLRQFGLDFFLFAATLTVCIAPWLVRNYTIAGGFIFDHPESQSRVMAQRYDFNGDFDRHERRPGEETGEYSSRLTTSIRQTIMDHPLYVAEFIGAHFLNNEIADVLIMPIRWEISSPGELFFPTSPFWQKWSGTVTWKQGLLLAANLAIIALGIAVSWKKYRFAGLLPLFINLTYNLSTALARFSGWRYLLPVDWIAYFYYAVGLTAIIFLFINYRKHKENRTELSTGGQMMTARRLLYPPIGKAVIILIIAAGFGGSLVLAEKIFPRKYSPQDNELVIAQMLENPVVKSSGIDLKALAAIQSQPNTFVVKGRALYPRYYHAGEGEAKTAKTGYEPSPDARLVFLTAATPDGLTIFKTDTSPEYFPNGVDVSIVGCQHPLYAQALIITVHGEREATYIASDANTFECEE